MGTTPVLAQATAPVTAPSTAALPEARAVVERLWPLGTYRRLMDGTMTQMTNAIFEQMFDVPAKDMLPDDTPASAKAKREAGNKTIGQLAAAEDPYFRERMRITNEVMFREMLPLFDAIEPRIRDSLTSIYARKFTPAQLRDLNAFLATPTGAVYAREWMTSFTDPEIVKGMQSFVPELMKAMPSIMTKVADATKHLPPPKRKSER